MFCMHAREKNRTGERKRMSERERESLFNVAEHRRLLYNRSLSGRHCVGHNGTHALALYGRDSRIIESLERFNRFKNHTWFAPTRKNGEVQW